MLFGPRLARVPLPMPRSSIRPLLLAFVVLAALGCDQKVGAGVRCYTDDDCTKDTGCFLLDDPERSRAESVCLRFCDASQAFCDEGEVCAPSEDDPSQYICLLGGPIQTLDQCDYSWQCERGSLCTLAVDVPLDYCFQACDTALPNTCPLAGTGEAAPCVDIDPCDQRTLGYCTSGSPPPPSCGDEDAGVPADAGAIDAGAADSGTP